MSGRDGYSDDDTFDGANADVLGDDTDDVTFSVAEFAELINTVLRRGVPSGAWVRGEIQGLYERAPHQYFTIVDDTPGVKAQLRVQLFGFQRNRLRPMLERAGVRLQDGVKVRIAGTVDYWAQGGTIGLKMSDIDPRFTLGELALQRAELVKRLKETGLYDRNRTTVLSPAPLRLGVVTSAESAAWADFSHEIERSGHSFVLRLLDVRVQGDQALVDVPAAIAELGGHRDLDAVVVVRGGGGRADLATFDAEQVAVAIARCPLPVFTGIGHEIDSSIADEVAYRALKTPTACAAALVEIVQAFVADTEDAWAAIRHRADAVMASAAARVDTVAHGVRLQVSHAIARSDRTLTSRATAIRDRVRTTLVRSATRLDRSADRLRRMPERLDGRARAIDAAAERLRLLDPATTMARGWSITRTADGRVVLDAAQIAAGDSIITTFANGTATSRVEEVST
jgi:exodeoxyribonuclease VII large subunit